MPLAGHLTAFSITKEINVPGNCMLLVIWSHFLSAWSELLIFV
jgi:hypothetical protein